MHIRSHPAAVIADSENRVLKGIWAILNEWTYYKTRIIHPETHDQNRLMVICQHSAQVYSYLVDVLGLFLETNGKLENTSYLEFGKIFV